MASSKTRSRSRPRSPARIAALIGGVALLLLIGVKLVGAWWRSDHPRPADSAATEGGGLGALTERLLGGRERAPSAVKSAPDPVAGELAAALTPYGIAARRIDREHMTEVVTGRQKAERWRVPLPGGLSLVKVNLAITEVAPRVGLEVLDAWEEPTQQGNGLTMTLGRKGQLHYRLEFAPTDSLAPGAVAILIGGFGPDWDQTGEDFLGFPAPISIAVLPGYQGSEKIADAARKAGVEVLLHLPMEPDRYPQVNPGPEAILVHLKPAEVRARMRRALNELGPVRGIAAYMGSRATTDPELVEIVLDETRRQGLFFLDNGVAARSVVPAVARRLGTPCVTSEVVLDGNRDAKAITRQMAVAVKLAESSRDVVVIGHGYPETYAVLRAVLPELRARGIEVVSVSRLAGAELPLDAAASNGR